MSAEPLTIALVLEATDEASELIATIRENVESLADQAAATSDAVAAASDKMTTALEGTADASATLTDSMARATGVSDDTSTSLEAQAAATDQLFASTQALADSTDELILSNMKLMDNNDALIASTEENSVAMKTEGDTAEETGVKMESLNKATNVLGLALVAAAAVGIKMALDFQKGTATLAGNADISTEKANQIGDAFLNTGGKTEFTANQMMDAFAPVSGAFVNLYGHALDVKQSMDVMNASMTLAEASGSDLTSTTAAVANVMTAFHLKVTQAAMAANDLFNTSRLLGISNDTLGTSIARLEPKIAGSGISLQQLTGFMTEFAKSAGNGRTAVRLAGTFLQSIVTPSSSASKELATLGINVDNSQGKFIGLTSVVGKLHDALTKLPGTTNLVVQAQKAYQLQTELTSLGSKDQTKTIQTQEESLSSQISALNGASDALSKTTVMQELFGKNAALATKLVAEGVPGLEKAAKLVAKQGTAAHAAALQEKTFEGELAKLKSAAEELFIKLGKDLLPAMVKLAGWTIRIVSDIVKWVSHNKTLALTIVSLVGAVVAFVKIMELATAITKAWAAAQTLLDGAEAASEFGLIMIAIALLVAEIIVLVKYWRDIYNAGYETRVALEEAWNDVASWFDSNVIQPVVGFFEDLWDDITSAAVTAYHGVLSAWNAVASWFENDVINPIVGFFETLWNGITSLASSTWSGVKGVWDAVSGWFSTEVIDPVVGFFKTLWDGITSLASSTWSGVKGVWNAVASWFDTEVIDPVVGFFKTLWDGISSLASSTWSGIKGVWDAVSSWFDTEVIDPIIGFFKTLWDGITSLASSTWTGLQGVWDAVSGWFDNTVIKPIEKFFEDLWDKIVSGAKTAVGGLENAFKGVASALNPISDLKRLGSVIGLAAGGIVSSPTLAVVGEAGPEMVLPLSQVPGGASSLSGGGVSALPSLGGSSQGQVNQVVINMSGQVYGSLAQLANALGRQLATVTVPGSGTRLQTR